MQICGLLSMPSVRRRNVMMALGLLIFVRVAVTAKMQVRYAFLYQVISLLYQESHRICTRALRKAKETC